MNEQPTLTPEEAAQGNPLGAIKLLRVRLGLGLSEAKAYYDHTQQGQAYYARVRSAGHADPDSDEGPDVLDRRCQREPMWAANRIRVLEAERDEARDEARVCRIRAEHAERDRDEARAAWDVGDRRSPAEVADQIVTWLRARAAATQEPDNTNNAVSTTYRRIADAIERGEHSGLGRDECPCGAAWWEPAELGCDVPARHGVQR